MISTGYLAMQATTLCRGRMKIGLAKYGQADFPSIGNSIITTYTMQPLPLVSIIIVTWNGAKVLGRCLDSLAAQTYPDFETIVIDNGSTDRSADGLEARWPGIRLERLEHNCGFAAANNLGAHLARGRWLALLNNDAFPAPDWLESLMSATQSYSNFSFFASRLIQANDPARLDGAGDVYHMSGLAWRQHHNRLVSQVGDDATEVFSPCAAAALYPREAFLQVGGFDEAYFSYHEDVDLGFRLRLQGLRCLYIPQAAVYHIGSASHGARSDFVIYYGHRNLVWAYVKNMPGYLFWLFLPAHLSANLFFVVYYSLRGQGRAVWRAKLDALRGLPTVMRKRREVQRTRRASASEISRVMDRGWLSPYLGSRWRRD